MFEELKIRVYPLRIKQRIIWGALIGLVTFAGGLAVAVLTTEPMEIVRTAATIQDHLTYRVITNAP